MARKRKAIPDLAEPSAAQIARMTGLSISRVYRLLQEGRSAAQIIAQAQQRKEAEAALRDLPVVPVNAVNGHAAAAAVLSFSASQAQKEMWAARLKELEFMERSSTLIPISYVKFWGANFIVAIKDEMMKVGELRDTLAAESDPVRVQVLLDSWVSRVCDRVYRLEALWAPVPPEVA